MKEAKLVFLGVVWTKISGQVYKQINRHSKSGADLYLSISNAIKADLEDLRRNEDERIRN